MRTRACQYLSSLAARLPQNYQPALCECLRRRFGIAKGCPVTDLEIAILDILRRFRPGAMTISDIQTQLLGQGWTVYAIPPHSISEALFVLEDDKQVRNELCWRALADPEAK